MVPQDQQLEVTSPGMISDELDLDSGFAINTFTTAAHQSSKIGGRRGGENPGRSARAT
jgi:hypothetical protein